MTFIRQVLKYNRDDEKSAAAEEKKARAALMARPERRPRGMKGGPAMEDRETMNSVTSGKGS